MNATRWFGGVGRLLPILVIVAATVLVPARAHAGQQDLEIHPDVLFGWFVSYDPDDWQVDVHGGPHIFVNDDAGFVYFEVDTGELFEGDVDDCVEYWTQYDVSVVDEDELDRPEAPADGEALLVRRDYNDDGGLLDYRLCVGGLSESGRVLLVVDWSVAEADYENTWPIVADLLDTFERGYPD